MSESRFPLHSRFDRGALLFLALALGLVVTVGTLGLLQRPSLAASMETGVSAPEAELPAPGVGRAAVARDLRERPALTPRADAPPDSGGASLVLPAWFADVLAPQAIGVWPDCGWNCTAADVTVTDAWLGEAGGTELPPCTPGQVVTAYVWAEFDNGTSTDRYAVRVIGGVYVDGTRVYTVDDCVTDTLGPGLTDHAVYSFTWTCGDKVEIGEVVIPWKTSSGSTCASTEPPACNDYSKSQCGGPTSLAVRAPLVANFDASAECFCTDTVFGDITSGGTPFTDTAPYSYTYSWDFGDGAGTSDAPTPTHHYDAPGTYTVTLVVTDAVGTSDTQTETVTVYENPVASFEAEPTSCCNPLSVQFTDTSTAALGAVVEAWHWDFGDGGTSSQEGPSHAYAAGSYTVTLTVTDSNGCTDAVTETYVAWFINVVKEAVPADGTDFGFTANFTTAFFGGSFTLDDAVPDDGDGVTGTETLGTLVASDLLDPDFTYRITETVVDGWILDGITCFSGGASVFTDSVTSGGSSVDVTLSQGDEVTCTFTNEKKSAIAVEKVVEGEEPEEAWGFTGDLGAFSIAAGGGISTFASLEAGTYAITETVKDGYAEAVVCDSGESGLERVTVDLGPGEDVTCVFTNTAQPGSIVVEKVVEGEEPEEAWGFTGDLGGFTIAAGGGISTFESLEAGTYAITETAKDGYGVAVVCDSGESGLERVTVDLGPGEDVTCVFTNTAQPGSIVVEKVVEGEEPEEAWGFTGDLGGFTIAAGGGISTFASLEAGTYAITETVKEGYAVAVVCDSGESGSGSVSVELGPGEDVTCVFTNTAQPGSIVVEKVVEGEVPEEAWGFTGDLGGFTIAAGGGISTFASLEAGTYAITETVKDGYAVAVACDSGESGSGSVSVELEPGEDVTCVFTNTAQPGSIVVEKVVEGEEPEEAWGFTGDLGAFSIAAGGGISTSASLEAGTYAITETAKEGYAVAVACDSGESGSQSVTVELGLGEDVTCVFTNTAQPEVAVDKRLAGFDRGAYYVKAITFTIIVANVGPNPIDVLPLEDVYDPYYISFADATPYPEEDTDDGTLAWYDLTGAAPHGFGVDLAPGDAFSVTAVFTVAHEIVTTVNTAVVSGAVDAYDNIVPYAEDDLVVRDTPTAVELLYFRVDGVEGREVALGWATAVELDTLGFGLYRAAERDRSRAQLVASVPTRGQGIGAAYTHSDAVPADGVWWYWLGKIGSGGDETVYGPVASAVGVSAGPARVYLPVVLRR